MRKVLHTVIGTFLKVPCVLSAKDLQIFSVLLFVKNCPCHIQIYNKGVISYKDLPIRMSEFGSCHRNEMSGSLNGLLRMRSFVQDDAHIFCREDQIINEVKEFCNILLQVYSKFGFDKDSIKIMFSDRPEKRIGSDDIWDLSESNLLDALREMDFNFSVNKGEGAFYGPKIEFILKDNLDREWQCGVLQLDFNLPNRLNAYYVDENNKKQHPVMIHRAILGSLERFIGILLEHHQGKLPFWLSPIQVNVCSINKNVNKYCEEINNKLINLGIRSELDISNEKFNIKMAKKYKNKIPYVIVIGEKEMKDNMISIKNLRDGSQRIMDINEISNLILI